MLVGLRSIRRLGRGGQWSWALLPNQHGQDFAFYPEYKGVSLGGKGMAPCNCNMGQGRSRKAGWEARKDSGKK